MLMFHRGGQSGSFESLLASWRKQYPQIDIVTVDLYEELFGSRSKKLRALPRALYRSGVKVLCPGGGSFMDALRHSLWMSQKLTSRAQEIQGRTAADVSFSFGTTYDAAWTGRPHFIYTDLTILGNLYYPDGAAAFERWVDWLPGEHRALQRAHTVFTHSEMVNRSLAEQYAMPASQARCVRCGSNTSPIVDLDPRRFENGNILFVGFDWERKGGPQLVQAFEAVRRRLPGATLTVVGCSPAIGGSGIEVLGRQPIEEVARCMGQAAVFCMPSLREPFGYVYLEAMQAGLPVVAARRGPSAEFIRDGHNGFTVDPHDTAELAERLYTLLSDPQMCRTFGERGRHIVDSEYSWTRTCNDITETIYGALQSCQ